MNAFRAGYVFDLDGTILDTMPVHYNAWKLTGVEYGFTLDECEFYSLAGKPTRLILENICERHEIKNIDFEAALFRKQQIYCSLLSSLQPIEVILKIAREAKECGYPIAIATGTTAKQAYAALQSTGLQDFFNIIITSDVSEFRQIPSKRTIKNNISDFCRTLHTTNLTLKLSFERLKALGYILLIV